ncbi:MAG: glucokinase [Colwellia sp.]|nr:glucokinase [Colwellia sp.]
MHLLSGFGLVQIYQALCIINDHPGDKLSAAEISAKALSGSCAICQQTLA